MKTNKLIAISRVIGIIINIFLGVFIFLMISAKPYHFSVFGGWIGLNLIIIGLPTSLICITINLVKRKSLDKRLFLTNVLLNATLPFSLLCYYLLIAQ